MVVVVELEAVKPVSRRVVATPEYTKPVLESCCLARLLYSALATYVLLRVAMVLVGMYLLVSDTVVMVGCEWSFLEDSWTFEPPSCWGVGEEVLVSSVLSGVLRASSINS